MKCPRCGENMKETRGTHHKKKKWKCQHCSKVRFTDLRGKYKKNSERDPGISVLKRAERPFFGARTEKY